MTRYVPLRMHSLYSVGEGAIRLKGGALVQYLTAAGMPACAITDTNSLAGIPEFTDALQKAGIQPIMGTEVRLQEGSILWGSIVLLAATRVGLQRLVEMSSKAAINGPPGGAFLQLEDLAGDNEGLLCLSGGLQGPVDQALLLPNLSLATSRARWLQDHFPGRFLLEISRLGTQDEIRREQGLLSLASCLKVPLVATNEAFFLSPDHHAAHDALLCISGQTYLAVADRRRVPENCWLKGPDDMEALFQDLPEALENTVRVAKACGAMFEERKPMLPSFPGLPDGDSEEETLTNMARKGLDKRLQQQTVADAAPYRERLDFELDVILRMGFAGYFLIVADFIQWSKRNRISVGPGRGSGAGSLVAWALDITDLDPLPNGLLFERFLNPDRVSMPDFDIDFCQGRRDQVIEYVRGRYNRTPDGQDVLRVAQIVTYSGLKARAAVKAVGRVMGLGFSVVERFSQMVPNNPANPVRLQEAMAVDPLSRELMSADPGIVSMFQTALLVEDLYSNISTHAAGVVISREPIARSTPLVRDPKGRLITQYNMKYVEKDGQVKFDFLGLKTLDMIQGAVEIEQARGVDVALDRVGVQDPETFATIARGETYSVFQFESSGMREAIRQVRPDRFADLVALGALYRPGPMANIPQYARIKNGLEAPQYLHPMLEPVLRETNGIVVYQEQVMQIARDMAGYSLGQADLLRRAMGKKIKAEMDAQRTIFEEGAAKRGVAVSIARAVFDLLERFADYGFNKSHAAAYAVLSFQTAYMKTHHPEAFYASAMNLELGKVESLAEFVYEVRASGTLVLPPDINRSQSLFGVERQGSTLAVRYGLAALRGVGQDVMDGLIEHRDRHGLFTSLHDVVSRGMGLGLNKKNLEGLAFSGALDSIAPSRGAVIQGLDQALRFGAKARSYAQVGQGLLFDVSPEQPFNSVELSQEDRLAKELHSLGLYLSEHPLTPIMPSLRQRKGAATLHRSLFGSIEGLGGRVRIAVVVMKKPEFKKTRGGKSMAVLTVSDPTHLTEVVLFDDKMVAFRGLLEKGAALLLDARIGQGEEGAERRLWIEQIERLPIQAMLTATARVGTARPRDWERRTS